MIIIRYRDTKRLYEYHLSSEDISDLREHHNECQTNGSNPWLENLSFEHIWRSITFKLDDIRQYKTTDSNHHGIFGWHECIEQDRETPQMKLDKTDTIITILSVFD
jgi:hypothetical protein